MNHQHQFYIKKICLTFLCILTHACFQINVDTNQNLQPIQEREDYFLDFRDKERVEQFTKNVMDEIRKQGLLSKENYAITLHHYIVTTPNSSGKNRAFNATGTGIVLEYDIRFLNELTTNWGLFSINAIYKDTGVWFKENVVYEIEDPVTGTDKSPNDPSGDSFFPCSGTNGGPTANTQLTTFGGVDDFIFNRQDMTFTLSTPLNSAFPNVISSCNEFRILWLRTETTDNVGYSIALLGRPTARMAATHPRNILAHELGHNFTLNHINEYYPSFPSTCNFSNGTRHSMYTPILPTSYGFSPCEIAIIQATVKNWLEEGALFIEMEAPTESNLRMGTAFYNNNFGNVPCGTITGATCAIPDNFCYSYRESIGPLLGRFVRRFDLGNHIFSDINRTLELGRRSLISYYESLGLTPPTLPIPNCM